MLDDVQWLLVHWRIVAIIKTSAEQNYSLLCWILFPFSYTPHVAAVLRIKKSNVVRILDRINVAKWIVESGDAYE